MARADGEAQAHRRWLAAFQDRVGEPTTSPDLTLGRCSIVVGASHAVADADPAWPEVISLAERMDGLLAGIWRDVEESPPRYLGIAHGWAGILYASLLWSRATGWRPPPALHASLSLLAGEAEPGARGACWPVMRTTDEPPMYVSGWCNGSAGQVMLWTLAHRVLGEERWRRLAVAAAWDVVDAPVGVSSLCCGAAGEIYALLSAFRCTGDDEWLARASARAVLARGAELARDATSGLSLYKGHAGLAMLAVELERPHRAVMPLFEIETP
jgi:serine/threonine-protein kinase